MKRTITAIAVLVVSLVVSCTPRPGDARATRSGVVGGSRFTALWPEQTLAASTLVQRAVDAGDPEFAWRTHPVSTAERFAGVVLGWSSWRIELASTWKLPSGIEISRVWLCDVDGCPVVGAAFDEEVTLKRLTASGEGGVWSVTDVTSGRLLLEQSAEIRIRDPHVREGQRLDALSTEGGVPDGTRVVAGSTTLGPCGLIAESTTSTVRLSRVRFQVAAHVGRGCGRTARPSVTPGYVFVYPHHRGMATDPATLFTQPRPDGSTPILDLTAIAVRFTPRDEVPGPPPSWRSRDPSTLPACRPEQLEGAIGAGRAVPGFGVGVFFAVRKASGPACHVVIHVRLALLDEAGTRIAVPGPHTQRLEGYLPGYVPGTRALYAGWGLFGWCGRDHDEIAVSVRTESLTTRQADTYLAQWCTSRAGHPRLEVLELDPTP